MCPFRVAVDYSYTLHEQHALFQVAQAEDVDRGGRYDARSATIGIWSRPWRWQGRMEESELIGTFYFSWADTPGLWQIEIEAGLSLGDVLLELGRLELKALGRVNHGDVPEA